MSFFTLNYPKTILFIAGVVIGITTAYSNLTAKIVLFLVGIILVYVSEYLRKKEED